jgi:hypothetical protein
MRSAPVVLQVSASLLCFTLCRNMRQSSAAVSENLAGGSIYRYRIERW